MKLPKQLFVKIDGDKPDEFYNAANKAEDLVEIADAMGVAQIVPPKPVRHKR